MCRLLEVHRHQNHIRTGVGSIDDSGHRYNGFWVAFTIRDGGGVTFYDFSANPGFYNVRIGPERPTIRIDERVPIVSWMRFDTGPVLSGFGCIAESMEHLRRIPHGIDWPDL
jgi:hypothetical protein